MRLLVAACKRAGIFAMLALLQFSQVSAQQQSIQDGVYTAAQAETGKILYDENCQHCHDLTFYTNKLQSFAGMTLLDFWYAMLRKMPADNPGSLGDSQYLEIIAFVLSQNGYPAGDAELVPSNQLGRIRVPSLSATQSER
ncbi:MAG: cytochrome c [Proteobacteria bacterium]|nr:cytochrome c [Pseudomonadota bacterium]